MSDHNEYAERMRRNHEDEVLYRWMRAAHHRLDEALIKGEPAPVRYNHIRTNKNVGLLIYQLKDIDALLKQADEHHKIDDNGQRKLMEKLKNEPRWKLLAQISDSTFAGLESLKQKFPNFENVINALSSEMTLHALGDRCVLQFEPKLLIGPPGVGKTRFMSELANVMGTTFYQKSLATTSASFALAGMHKGWASAAPGFIVNTLRESCVANPIIMLDEIDKVSAESRYNPEKVFLSLFEKHSAKTFQDEFVEVPFDCSCINWVATANDPKFISEPILSRLQVFGISSPTAEQTVNIALSVYRELIDEYDWGKQFAPRLDEDVISSLAKLSPRLIRRNLLEACANAANRTGQSSKLIRIEIKDMHITSSPAKKSIGFF